MSQDMNGEGKQTQLLRVILRKAVEDVINGLPTDQLISCCKDVPNFKSKKLKKIIEAFLHETEKAMESVVNNLINTEDIDVILKNKESILEQQREMEGTIAWRPSGSVVDDIRAHDMEELQTRRKQISVMVELKEQKLEALSADVTKIHRSVKEYQTKLISASQIIKKARKHIHLLNEASMIEHSSLAALPKKNRNV